MQILVTNNPLVDAQFKSKFNIELLDTDVPGVLTYVRDLVHKGHQLLTHPLSGSVKPNETIYKSILVTDTLKDIDPKSINIIEECILTTRKFPPKYIPDHFKHDMQLVDLALIHSALVK